MSANKMVKYRGREQRRPDPETNASLWRKWLARGDRNARDEIRSRGYADPYCPQCRRQAGGMGPGHYGSTGCLSGSLASGGTMEHCTCDACF